MAASDRADLCWGGESSGPPAATDMARCHLLMIWYRRSICLYSFWRLWGMCKAETLTFKRARDVEGAQQVRDRPSVGKAALVTARQRGRGAQGML